MEDIVAISRWLGGRNGDVTDLRPCHWPQVSGPSEADRPGATDVLPERAFVFCIIAPMYRGYLARTTRAGETGSRQVVVQEDDWT